jgi:hypothetical protein
VGSQLGHLIDIGRSALVAWDDRLGHIVSAGLRWLVETISSQFPTWTVKEHGMRWRTEYGLL